MNKIALVARREYFFNLRRRSFLFAVFGVPLFTFVIWAIIFLVLSNTDQDLKSVGSVGYVDQSGILTDLVIPLDKPELAVPYVAYTTEADARAALDAKTIGAYFVLPQDYLKSGDVKTYSYSGIPGALKDSIDALLVANVSKKLGSDVPLARIENPVNLTIHALDSGRTLTEANIPALIFIPLIFAFVFLMSSNVTSGFLMNGVVEEKTNRIMEILITSVTPMQLLLGKIIGLGLLGLTQLLIWAAAGALLIHFGQASPALAGVTFPIDLMIVFVVYFMLSYFLLSSLMAGLGAIAGSAEESRQFSSIISLIWIIPFFLITSLISEPNGPLAVILTLIPFTAPMTVLLRMGFSTVPAWQLAASIIILLASALLVVWASSKVFRWALLLYGKRITLRELWHVIRQSPHTATVTAQSSGEITS
ncbi:MAG: ABC transporter permease [Chloroflexota bacterium]